MPRYHAELAPGIPVAILGPHTVFGCAHVATQQAGAGFGSAKILADGLPYVPPGSPDWVRYRDKSGAEKEEHASNFALVDVVTGGDRWIATTFRAMPAEAWTITAIPNVGDAATVRSRARMKDFTAKILKYDKVAGMITLDYPAQDGDSNSVVVAAAGGFVGFVAVADPAGCMVVTHGLESALAGTTFVPPGAPLPGSVPTPTPAPVPPSAPAQPATPGQIPQSPDFIAGFKAGEAAGVAKAKAALAALS